jgi:hypothetical protein
LEVKVGDHDEQHDPASNTGNKIRHAGFVYEIFFLINEEPCD